MFHAAVRLHVAVAAVVVGDKQTVGRNQFAGTAAAEQHDTVFHAMVINAIHVIGSKMESHLLHFGFIVAQEKRNPHSFVSHGEETNHHKGGEEEDFFHS